MPSLTFNDPSVLNVIEFVCPLVHARTAQVFAESIQHALPAGVMAATSSCPSK